MGGNVWSVAAALVVFGGGWSACTRWPGMGAGLVQQRCVGGDRCVGLKGLGAGRAGVCVRVRALGGWVWARCGSSGVPKRDFPKRESEGFRVSA